MATTSVWVRLLKVESKIVFASKFKSLRIPTLLKSSHSTTERQVLVDSGATDNFISNKLLKRLKIGKLQLKTPRTIWNIDGTHNKSGTIQECVNLLVWVGDKKHEMHFLITDLGEDEIVLGYPWLAAFQPRIDWKNATLDEEEHPLVIRTLDPSLDKEVARIRKAWIQSAEDLAEPGEEIFVWKLGIAQMKKASTSTQLAAKAKPQEEKTWDQIVPPQCHKWRKVFSEKEARRLPKHQPWDIAINLVGGDNHALDCKVCPLPSTEGPKLDKHILDMLEKGFIHLSKSKICSPLFFVGKKDGKERPVIDYRRLNSIMEPDRFPIPLLQEMIDKVQRAILFSKVDIREGFYNIRVAEGDEWKAAFKTNSGCTNPQLCNLV